MNAMKKIKVLFVCMGNICRSPTAEGVFTNLVSQEGLSSRFVVDSAGTHAYHEGEPPDRRAQTAAKARKIELQQLRARRFTEGDFDNFDYILAMDSDNYRVLSENCPEQHQHKLGLFLDYAPEQDTREVPDPYYGGRYGFERVLDLVEAGSAGFIRTLRERGELE